MTTLTIPQGSFRDGFVVLPRRKYEELLASSFSRKEVVLNSSQKNRLQVARKNLNAGKFLIVNELRKKVGVKN
ncbi:hypothetical protein A3I84_01405 [Candidatus Nomurabacteria bacterium RIFCSPLOWO2_02_FULL_36_8]|nr:MAG: hypothetical protein A3C66_00285 [Candidatus Magasanikbacteria bacterium RIFCSPHIGHO2_02_FULL_41_35]OGI94781.1 MAG: hypothetical protein A3I84_01405 [Candidatus Nomurabacteria bacterium RIFCSPLOWO2_02_FULL_36_8]